MSNPLTTNDRYNLLLESPGYVPVKSEARGVFQRYEATIQAVEKENERIYAALLKHGRHVNDCKGGSLNPINACTCGFRTAIAVDHEIPS